MINSVFQNLRYSVRMLAKSPSFTFVAVLTLALGIGANATIFSFINGLILRPIAGVQQPDRLVGIYTSDYSSGRYGGSSYADFLDIRQQADLLADAAAYEGATLNLAGSDKVERVRGTVVTPNYFQVLGVGAQLGRTLRAEDDVDGSAPTCVLGYGFWQKRFGGDPSIIGRSLTLNNKAYTIVGVTPPAFKGLRLGQQPEVYLRMEAYAERGNRGIGITARLRNGASIYEAQTQIGTIADRLARAYPETNMGIAGKPDTPRPMSVVPEERIGPQSKGAMQGLSTLLFVVVGLVLLIACANVANLLLARASSRRREIAIRLALGASRWQLVRQLLLESILLSLIGGVAGLIISLWTADLIPQIFMESDANSLDLSLDWRLLTFTLAVSILTGLIFGLVPALQTSRPELVTALKDEHSGSSLRLTRFGLRGILVTAQVALSLLLLISAGLFLRSLRNAMTFDPGFENRHLLFASLATEDSKLTKQQVQQFHQEVVENLSAEPGVQSVSLTAIVPVGGGGQRRGLYIEGYVPGLNEESEINTNVVGLNYFQTMGIPLVQGRDFNSGDRAGSPGAVIVNEEFAQRYFPGQQVLGKRVKIDSERPYIDIVGVVRTAKYRDLREAPLPFIYIPLAQEPQHSMSLVVHTEGDPSALRKSVLATVRRINPNVPVYRVKTITEQIESALSPDRLMTLLLAIFGGVALLLASVGIYGVVSYAVSQRTREIGIRMALGATKTNVLRLVLREGMAMAVAGVIVGLAAALALTRLISSLLFGVTATDVATFAVITGALLLIALVACYIPASRATKVDPLVALRYE